MKVERIVKTEIKFDYQTGGVFHSSAEPNRVIVGLKEGQVNGVRGLDELIKALQEVRRELPGGEQ